MARKRDTGSKALAKKSETALAPKDGEAWRGDDHAIQIAAAKEAGLSEGDAALESFTEGFKAGMTVEDPSDGSIVLRGRTVLKEKQLFKSIDPVLRFLQIPRGNVDVRIHDGEFELRVGKVVADQAKPALDSAKVALQVLLAAGLVGWVAGTALALMSPIIWGIGLLVAGYTLRQGLVNGRSLLAARLAVSLGMLAKEEGLVLPPAQALGPAERAGGPS